MYAFSIFILLAKLLLFLFIETHCEKPTTYLTSKDLEWLSLFQKKKSEIKLQNILVTVKTELACIFLLHKIFSLSSILMDKQWLISDDSSREKKAQQLTTAMHWFSTPLMFVSGLLLLSLANLHPKQVNYNPLWHSGK